MKSKLAWAAATLFLITKSFAYPVPPVVLAPAYDNFTDHSCAETRCPNMFGEFLEPALSPVGVSPGDTVTNSFQWNKGAKAEFVRLVLWGSTPESLDWAITTEPFGGTKLGSGTEKSFTPEERASGMFMFDLDLNVWLPPGTYWLQLSNAIGAHGWDVSAGPSLAYLNSIDTPIDSESFAVMYPGTPQIIPEPNSAVLTATGAVLALALGLRKLHG